MGSIKKGNLEPGSEQHTRTRHAMETKRRRVGDTDSTRHDGRTAMKFNLSEGSTLEYSPDLVGVTGLLQRGEADKLKRLLFSKEIEHLFHERSIKLYGKEYKVPRKELYVAEKDSKPYSYSNKEMESIPWDHEGLPAELSILRSAIGKHMGGINFDTVLINMYQNGEDKVGWHSDSSPTYGGDDADRVPIVSVTFTEPNGERDFCVRPRKGWFAKDGMVEPAHTDIRVVLRDGSVCIMDGRMQRHWEHSVPARKGVTGRRVNLTFRTTRTFDL